MRRTIQRFLASAGVALAALIAAGPRVLLAQGADSAPPKAAAQKPDSTGGSPALATTSVPRYLANHPRQLHLTAKQSDRIREVATWLDTTNAPLRAQFQQVTGGRPLRTMRPADRRRLSPQLQPIIQGIRANNQAALDSVDAILNPAQQQQLQTLVSEYRQRMQQRQAHPAQP